MAIECIENLVGLIHPEKVASCNCYDANKPANFDTLNASDSGHYLIDDTDLGAPLLEAILQTNDCEDGDSVWQTLVNARQAALNLFEPELQAELVTQYDRNGNELIEELAERQATSTASISRNYAGQQVVTPRWKDWSLNITKIWTGFDENRTFDLTVRSNNPDFVEVTETLTANANAWTANTLSNTIVLPFWGKARVHDSWSDNRYLYNFSYDKPATAKALNNRIHCGCSGSIPRFWKFFQVHGFQSDTTEVAYSSQLAGNGLVLDGFLSCDNLQWICELTTSGNKDMQDVMALAIKYKSIAILAQSILDSGKVNFWSILDREQVYGKRNAARKKYDEIRTWIAYNLPKGATNCYQCKPTMKMVSI